MPDAFGRPDGAVGGSWNGLTGTAFHRVAGGRLAVRAGGPLLWPAPFGTAQEAFVTRATIAPSGPAQAVLPEVQAPSVPDAGAIGVAYDAEARAHRGERERCPLRSGGFADPANRSGDSCGCLLDGTEGTGVCRCGQRGP